jgi:class 3 adenylate cyclase/tetratricopeptide (TPR) repeat protein
VTEATRFDPGSPEAPRRLTATMLFSDLSESTQIAGGLQDEDYGDLLWRIQTIFHRIVGRHEGQIAQISADGMFAAFGYPEPREDDVRRAVAAALDLHDAVRALGSEERWRTIAPKLHSGIHTGRVLFVSGDEVRGRFELLGRHTNLASRLCKKAEPDQILVSERTLGPERYLFETGAPYPLQLRGRDHPLSTLAVTGRAPISSRYAASERAGLTPFVGREAELRQLLRGLEQVTSGKSLSLDIRGPAGEGKTRLAEEFLRHAIDRGCPVHRGECEATGEPLQPFIQIARSIFGIGPLLSVDEAVHREARPSDAPARPRGWPQAPRRRGGRRRELEASVLDQRSAVCLWQGRMEEALGFAQEAERIAERIRSKYDFAMSRALAGYARWKLEPTSAAVQAIIQATGWLEEGQRNQNISLNYGWLAEIMVENGRFDEARHYAACALRRARKRDPMGEAMALRAMARAAARNGGPRPPAHYLALAMASARARGAPHEIAVTLLCEAELALAAGDPVRAEPLLAAALAAFADMGMAYFTQRAEAAAEASR